LFDPLLLADSSRLEVMAEEFEFGDEPKAPVKAAEEEEELLIFMPVIRTSSDFPMCTDQHPDVTCRQCTDDCPCKPRPPPVPKLLPKPKDPNRCHRCKMQIIVPTKYVWPKATPFRYTVFGDLHYHRKCFRCNMCDRSLFVDVMIRENGTVFRQSGDVVCVKCDAKLKSAWCNLCDQPIRFHREKCEDKEYHKDCLKCSSCSISLVGHKRAGHHQRKPFCGNCLSKMYGTKCKECKMLVPNGIQSFYFRGDKYHFGCFRCSLCLDPLISPGGPDKPVMVRGGTKLCLDCFPKWCSNCGTKLPRGSGHYEVDDNGVIKCLECAHIGFNRKLKGKKLTPPANAAIAEGLGIGEIVYGDSQSEESQGEEEEGDGKGKKWSGRQKKKKPKKQFSTWGAVKKPEPEVAPKKLSNDMKFCEELYTIYMIHNDAGGEPTIINPNAKDEDGGGD